MLENAPIIKGMNRDPKHARSRSRATKRLFSNKAERKVFRAFRRTPDIIEYYFTLKKYYEDYRGGHEDPWRHVPRGGFYDAFRDSVRQVVKRIRDKQLKGQIRNISRDIRRILRKIDDDRGQLRQNIRRVVPLYADMIVQLAKSRNIYLKEKPIGAGTWVRFEIMRPEERRMEKLKERDPDLYDMAQEENEVRDQIDRFIKDRIQDAGYDVEERPVLNKPVNFGIKEIGSSGVGVGSRDPDNPQVWRTDEIPGLNPDLFTGEAIEFQLKLPSGESFKIEEIGDGYLKSYTDLPDLSDANYMLYVREAYVVDEDDEVMTEEEYRKKRKRHLRSIDEMSKVFTYDFDDLRGVEDDMVDEHLKHQETEKYAITDDKKKQKGTTRVVPTIEIGGQRVIAKGKFKGVYLDDLINRAGRMIEGTAYDFNTDLGRPVPLEKREGDELKVDLHDRDEPYITETEDCELYVRIPSKNGYWTEIRNNVYELSKSTPHVTYLQEVGHRREAFRFEPRVFDSVRNALESCALSRSAMECVRDHYERERRLEEATEKEQYEAFSKESLGGFKDDEAFPGFWRKQKQALSWLDENGDQGLLAAETGTGKTLIAIGYIRNLMRKDILYNPGQDRVLFVCPSSLEGNLKSEIKARVANPEEMLQYLEVMSYWHFPRQPRDIIDDYTAVIFDEASQLKNRNTKTSLRAQREHPHKLLLTASPMENDPSDMYTLASIAQNRDIQSKEGLRRRRQFTKRYCEKVGSKTIGVNNDPQVQRDLDSWVRQNMFHIDKEAVEEADLPDLIRKNQALTMSPQMEETYREKSEEVRDVLRGMVRLYRDRDRDADDPKITNAIGRLSSLFKELQEFSNQPEKFVDDIDENPKLSRASDIIKERVDQNRRTVLWTDSADFARRAAEFLSDRFPGLKHAYATSSEIVVLKNGERVNRYTKRYYTNDQGERVDKDQWKQFILSNRINPIHTNVFTCTLTQSYTHGFNLQSFAQVIHLDRDDWNSEEMKQRTARTWRSGQDERVQEVNLDMTYQDREDEYDRTLDEIRKYMQEMGEELFDALVVETQQESETPEFFDIDQLPASYFEIKRDLMELAASPVLENHAELKSEVEQKIRGKP
jgi:hypothetical protein